MIKKLRELGIREFGRRWKQGIQQATPLQLTRINIIGTLMVYAGIGFGLYFTATSKMWWLFTILCGSTILTTTTFVGTLQRYWALKQLNLGGGLTNEEQILS